ncbi:MAG TPA: 3-methyl-2-oxobutanoate dehydrogenase subunit VorB [Bryobacteraceae bacterium]|nr:3-methyl-2-oxobutanoate dehydrogenase subunit VorB [Bryobacteraceae bacterium]
MAKQLLKGNEAIMRGAILAGCRAFYGYPITPATEITEAAARLMPQVGGTFLQAESETAAINMLYGAASTGIRCMTSSSGPGISLMQEGLSYLAGAELPCVIADVMRGGPGLGNIAPEQGDYFQVVKGGGHGCYRTLVLAPDSVQEMCDLTVLAFELADEYRNPAILLADGYIGQMMEAVELPEHAVQPPPPWWAVRANAETRRNFITSIYLEPEDLELHIRKLETKYRRAEEAAVRFEAVQTDDADLVLVGYGIVARILKSVVRLARGEGLRVGLLRPISLYPFPSAMIRALARTSTAFLAVELSTGQMVDDVRLAVEGRRPVDHYGRMGGVVPSAEEILGAVRNVAQRLEVAHA